ncbi:hypothetical protein B0O99DRAFT_717138 [Bisporella sp. PMI_857]|nr:hypothetical protein B0O99DRAFT_717138 [Bisporella sp. PMI_857]
MSGGSEQPPKLGATFYPGYGTDDYYMPEVVSPAPQRIMPEVPSNMQDQLAHLELEARSAGGNRVSSQSTASSMTSPTYQHSSHTRDSSLSSVATSQMARGTGPAFTASYQHTNAAAYQNLNRASLQQFPGLESPKFSPFPKLRDAGNNVPLSDDEKEEILFRARSPVLNSTDPEMQLAWAQDALNYVEIISTSASRERQADGLPPRSSTPRMEHEIRVDALSIVNFLAEQHHPKAEFMKGMWLEFGKFGYRLDKKEAFQAYTRSAGRGYARADYRIGMQYETSNNAFKAIEHYQKGVAMRDSASNYRLGMMTLLGQHDTRQDYQRGIELIRFAAETADENAPQGAYIYGMLLARELPNISVPDQYLAYDLNDAKIFIEKAAYLGFSKAQLKMAQAYELCQLGCEFEPALSLHYNALASRQGESEADMAISKWFLCGYEGVFEKNEELAFTYAKRAAATKMPTAEFAMGYFYEIGMYVPVDLRESEIWYQKAAEHGNKDALGRIDSIKRNNVFSKKDHEQVAISRIKSQYGSQRGVRPDRFKQRGAALPSIPDSTVDMPDPRNSYAGRAQNSTALPPRSASTAPYPEDDMPPIRGRQSLQTPSYNQGGLRANSVGPPADRPSSAFGIRPLNRGPNDPYSLQSPVEHPRPTSSQATWQPQVPQSYRQPSPGPGPNRAPTLPQVEPLRLPSMGRNPQEPNRLQKSAPSNPVAPQTPQPRVDSSYVQRRDPAQNHFVRPERGSSMTPITPESRMAHSQRPPQHTMSSQSARPDSTAPGTPTSTTSTGPPKKQGPATFAEMGIPDAKPQGDCVCLPPSV